MRRVGFFLLAISYLLFAAPTALAHGSIYFEFAPDPWASQRLIVTAGETPYQLFQPASDFALTAYDLWVDNTGEAGPVTFTLADSEGTTLATNSITLPVLPAIPGGSKLHINLASDVNLKAAERYSLKIDSALLGFGLYYADRLTFLSHNQNFTTEYINGVARLGQAQQSFTFKFALRTPSTTGGGTISDDPVIGQPTEETPAAQQIAISNARVVSVTDTSVTLAWTTDIASDSRASVRSQLNPLYVIAIGYDPTIELEHTVTITGLVPSVSYFADVFSSSGSLLVLTTYTIGFQTLSASAQQAAAPAPVAPPAQAPPAETPPVATPPADATPTTNTPTSDGSVQQIGSDQSGDGIQITEGSNSDQTAVSWNAPAGGEPSGGYRIDIFDYQHNLERQIKVPAGTHSKDIAKLDEGLHHAVVYAENDGVFTKVAAAASFLLQSQDTTMIWKIAGLVILWVVGLGGYFRWKFKKEKTVLPPEEGYDPNRS